MTSAASSKKQWESRAEHVAAKAMSAMRVSGDAAADLPGVGGTAHELTDRRRTSGVTDVRVLIEELNPVLQGWGEYFRTGNAARKFLSIDRYVTDRLHRFLVKRAGRNLRPGRAAQWTQEWFWGQGLHRLRGTVRYPKPCVLHEKTIGEPDAGKRHLRFERGSVVPRGLRVAPGH